MVIAITTTAISICLFIVVVQWQLKVQPRNGSKIEGSNPVSHNEKRKLFFKPVIYTSLNNAWKPYSLSMVEY